jgi:predicted ATPase
VDLQISHGPSFVENMAQPSHSRFRPVHLLKQRAPQSDRKHKPQLGVWYLRDAARSRPSAASSPCCSRLWQRQDKRAEAHQLLTEVYGWFTEGFDTADLQEAKAWLQELA